MTIPPRVPYVGRKMIKVSLVVIVSVEREREHIQHNTVPFEQSIALAKA
jgi:hypothetical protein